MKRHKWILVLGNLLVLLVYFNWTVSKKEQTLKEGELVLFQLAPVDPRSLMQGDYMTLNYEGTRIDDLHSADSLSILPAQGYAFIRLDSNRVARIVRLQPTPNGRREGEQVIKFHKHYRSLKLGAESFFFEEGQEEVYEKAVYGGLRIDAQGNSILVGLYDEHFRIIQP